MGTTWTDDEVQVPVCIPTYACDSPPLTSHLLQAARREAIRGSTPDASNLTCCCWDCCTAVGVPLAVLEEKGVNCDQRHGHPSPSVCEP